MSFFLVPLNQVFTRLSPQPMVQRGYFDESNGVLVCLVGTHADSAHQEVTEDEAGYP